MSKQPEALMLADELGRTSARIQQYTNKGGDGLMEAAEAELRRLHFVEEAYERCKKVCAATSEQWRIDSDRLQEINDELVKALEAVRETAWPYLYIEQQNQLDAAIAKATKV